MYVLSDGNYLMPVEDIDTLGVN